MSPQACMILAATPEEQAKANMFEARILQEMASRTWDNKVRTGWFTRGQVMIQAMQELPYQTAMAVVNKYRGSKHGVEM